MSNEIMMYVVNDLSCWRRENLPKIQLF